MNMCTNEIKDNPKGYRNPKEVGLEYLEVRIKTKDNLTLYGWFIFNSSFSKKTSIVPTFIYFHENAGNIGFRLPFAEILVNKLFANVLVVGYRGYGYSEGVPSEQGLMLDAEAIVDYVFHNETSLSEYIDKSNVFIFGRSLGGAVAIYIMDKLKPEIKGVILENTFSSMGDMVDHLFPFLKHVKNFLLKNKWPSKERIENIKCPILFLSSEKDELVPAIHMDELFQSANNAAFKHKYIIIGGTHNESWQKKVKEYISEVKEFMTKCRSFARGEVINDLSEIKNLDDLNEMELTLNEDSSINREEESYLINKKAE